MNQYMQEAIAIALNGIKQGSGPFGALVVKNGVVVGVGVNQVTKSLDPTAHAEVCAIRDACKNLQDFSLADCQIYTSCEPCPMCLGAIFWARISAIFYGATRDDAAKAQFDDHHFYEELKKDPAKRTIPMAQIMRNDCLVIFDAWGQYQDKIRY